MAIDISVFLVFLAGIVTAGTPCVIPIIPIILAGSIGHRLRPFFIVLGSMVTFTLMGGLFSVIGSFAGGSQETLRGISIFVIIGFGAIMADSDVKEVYMKYSSRLVNRMRVVFIGNSLKPVQNESHPLRGAFILGLSSGIVWLPCVGPTLGTVLTYVTYQGNVIIGLYLLGIYSLGFGLSLLAISYSAKHYSNKLKWVKEHSMSMERIAGWILILVGVGMLFGIDKFIAQMKAKGITLDRKILADLVVNRPEEFKKVYSQI